MGFLDSFLDNALQKFDDGLSTVENVISTGIDRVDQVSGTLEQGAQRVIETADRAVQSTDGLAAGGASDNATASDDDDASSDE